MKRIAIVACENSNTVCAGCACLNAFYDRRKSFERYAGEELRLMAFMVSVPRSTVTGPAGSMPGSSPNGGCRRDWPL